MCDPFVALRTAPKGTDEFREAVVGMIEAGRIDEARQVLDERKQAEQVRGNLRG